LARIGAPADLVLSGLKQIVETSSVDRDVRESAVNSLEKLGPTAIPYLVPLLKSCTAPDIARHVTWALRDIGPEGVAALRAAKK
jgi:hypothetical protein